MAIVISGRNVEVTEALRDYTEKKLSRIDKYFTQEPDVVVTLAVEKERHIVEVTVMLGGLLLRAEEATADMYASLDLVVDKLERQIRKFKTRINRRARRADGSKPLVRLSEEAEPGEGDDEEPRVVKTKRFAIKPMDLEEAILQMNLLGHDFFVFRNAASNEVNVVYRRRDGHYGLIEPRS